MTKEEEQHVATILIEMYDNNKSERGGPFLVVKDDIRKNLRLEGHSARLARIEGDTLERISNQMRKRGYLLCLLDNKNFGRAQELLIDKIERMRKLPRLGGREIRKATRLCGEW